MIRRTLAVVGLVILSVSAPVGVARADDGACGELHRSITLTHDVACDIRIMGPDITLDLGGFTVDGTISAGRHWSDTPLPDEAPVTNAVIRNGKATQVAVADLEPVFLEDLDAALAFHGATVDLAGVVASTVSVRGGSEVVFRDGVLGRMFSASGSYGCGTWVVEGSEVGEVRSEFDCDLTIRDSEVREIEMFSLADDVLRLSDSTVTGPVVLGGFVEATLEGNRFTGPDADLDVYGLVDVAFIARRNVFEGPHGVSIGVEDQATVDFSENVVRDGDGLSLWAYAPMDPDREVVLGTIRGNWLFDNTGSGIESRDESALTAYEIGGNRAWNNAGHGIDAPGDIDGTGNLAFGNTLSPQCIGVSCVATK